MGKNVDSTFTDALGTLMVALSVVGAVLYMLASTIGPIFNKITSVLAALPQ